MPSYLTQKSEYRKRGAPVVVPGPPTDRAGTSYYAGAGIWLTGLLRDSEEMRSAAQVEVAADRDRRRDEGLVPQGVGREHLVGRSHFHHDDVLVLGRQVEPSVHGDWRGLEVVRLGQALLLIESLAGLRIERAQLP